MEYELLLFDLYDFNGEIVKKLYIYIYIIYKFYSKFSKEKANNPIILFKICETNKNYK